MLVGSTDPRETHLQNAAPKLDRGLCAEALHKSSFNAFDESIVNVTVLEVLDEKSPLQKHVFDNSDRLAVHCQTASKPALRIISIAQESSFDPLQIDKAGMESLLRIHNVVPEFLSILSSAGQPPLDSEEGFGQPIESKSANGDFMITYLSRYYESRKSTRRMRHTGVYHAFSNAEKSNVFILLHPREDSTFQNLLEEVVGDSEQTQALLERPSVVHNMLFESYFDSFQVYLQDKGRLFQSQSDTLFGVKMRGDQVHVSFEQLQWWRDLEDQLLPLQNILQGTHDTLVALAGIDTSFQHSVAKTHGNLFGPRKNAVVAVQTSAAGLQRRVHGALNLLRDALELKNQQQLASISGNLYNLQKENIDDSATVRIITILSLIYLPGMFVASLFGTNLFVFNEKTSRMRMASNVYWYFILFVPLTILTLGAWEFQTRSARSKRDQMELFRLANEA